MAEFGVGEAELPLRLLLVDGARVLAARVAAPLGAEYAPAPVVVDVTAGRPALELLRGSPFDAVVADLAALGDLGGSPDERIGRLVRAASGALIVILSEDAGISISLAAMRAGAHDCVGRAIGGERLVALIGELALRHSKTRCLTRSTPPPDSAAEPPPPAIPNMRDLVMPMWRQEQRIIEEAIQQFAGNVALAAAALELSPSTIYRKRQAWAEMDGKRGAA